MLFQVIRNVLGTLFIVSFRLWVQSVPCFLGRVQSVLGYFIPGSEVSGKLGYLYVNYCRNAF